MTAAADSFIQLHSVLWAGSACLSMTEISSVLFKAPRMGGGGCADKEAGDKQKIGRHAGLRTHHPCTLSRGNVQ